MLKTERNTQATERVVLAAAREATRPSYGMMGNRPSLWSHGPIFTATFEHDQWWIECKTCGAQFSVVDSQPGYGAWTALYVDAVGIGMSSRSLTPKDAAALTDARMEEWDKRFDPFGVPKDQPNSAGDINLGYAIGVMREFFADVEAAGNPPDKSRVIRSLDRAKSLLNQLETGKP